MFSTFRKLTNFWGGANASVSRTPNATSTKAALAESNGSTSQAHESDSTGPAYRAAFNYAAPAPQYATKVVRTPSAPIAPQFALSGYFFSRVKDTGASHINNIPPPQVPLFGVTASTDARQGVGEPSTKPEDIDMPDANFQSFLTPPTTPPTADDAQHPPHVPSQHNERNAAAEDGAMNESPNAVPNTLVDQNERPQLIPVRQRDRQGRPTKPQPKTNWLDDIVIEEDTPENNLPVGYLGTFRGSRHFIPEYPGMLPCSHNTEHVLLCGHWISSSEPCGANCRKQNQNEKPFNCPTCHDIVREVLCGSFSATESMRLRKLREKRNNIDFVSCCVEQVVRAAPQLKTGVAEAVAGFFLMDYGRKCKRTENPDPEGLESIEWIVRDMQERTERKQREKFARENPLNTHEKRKSYEDTMNMSANAGNFANDGSAVRNKQSRDIPSTGEDQKQDVVSADSKKQKAKLESHHEPITPHTRGTKRSSPPPSPSDGNASSLAFTFGSESLRGPAKKVYTPPSPTFGEASFLSPPAHVVGAILRKRRHDADVDDEGNLQMAGGFKQRRVESWQASQDEVKTET